MEKELVQSARRNMNIPEDEDWHWKTVYSMIGRMALTAVWNCKDGVSGFQFRKNCRAVLEAYNTMYPELRAKLDPDNFGDVTKAILRIYKRNGFFYTAGQSLAAAKERVGVAGGCCFFRTTNMGTTTHASGLGAYSFRLNEDEDETPADVFGLPEDHIDDWLAMLEEESLPAEDAALDFYEYLDMDASIGDKLIWKQTPDIGETVSLARSIRNRDKFFLYQCQEDSAYFRQIPPWRITDFRADVTASGNADESDVPEIYGGLRRAALAAIMRNEKIPPILTRRGDMNVTVILPYRLPPEEEDFFMLYGWPDSYQNIWSQTRTMSDPVFRVFQAHMKRIGFRFERARE